jgi:hypothetical protein
MVTPQLKLETVERLIRVLDSCLMVTVDPRVCLANGAAAAAAEAAAKGAKVAKAAEAAASLVNFVDSQAAATDF